MNESHGRHWEAIIPDKEAMIPLIEYWNAHAIYTVLNEKTRFIVHQYTVEKNISVVMLSLNNQFATCFPVINGPKTNFQIETVEMWSNQLEGNLDLRHGRVLISAFDTSMYLHRSQYNEDLLVKAYLGSIAYDLHKEEIFEREFKGKKVSTRDSLLLVPAPNAPPDEYQFQTYIRRVKELKIFDREFFIIDAALFQPLGLDEKVCHFMLVAKANIANNYIPKPGDAVSGTLWLQARIEL